MCVGLTGEMPNRLAQASRAASRSLKANPANRPTNSALGIVCKMPNSLVLLVARKESALIKQTISQLALAMLGAFSNSSGVTKFNMPSLGSF